MAFSLIVFYNHTSPSPTSWNIFILHLVFELTLYIVHWSTALIEHFQMTQLNF